MTIVPRQVKASGYVALFAILMAALFDWLFYGHAIGWTAALFLAAAVAGVIACRPHVLRHRAGRVLALANAGLVAALALEPTALAITLAGLVLAMLALTARCGWTPDVPRWLARFRSLVCWLPIRAMVDSRLVRRWQTRHGKVRQKLRPPAWLSGLKPWIAPALLGGLFAGLFWLANPVLEFQASRAMRCILDLIPWFMSLASPVRWSLWLAVGCAVWALLRARPPAAKPAVPPTLPAAAPWAQTATVIRCLIVFNILFAIQLACDGLYLWGGVALPPGMTYAQYAHRGSYVLVATAILAATFVLLTFRAGGDTQRSIPARMLVFAWVAQNVVLTIAAAWRLVLYVDVYSLSRWRLAAGVWMLLVALGLVWIVTRILLNATNAWLVRRNTLTAMVVLYALCFFNADGYIADFNVRHCREVTGDGAPLDWGYLYDLRPASLPAMQWMQARRPADDLSAASLYTAEARDALDDTLADWRGWTWRRSQIAAATP